MEKLKIAIVGCGGIANQKHMPSIRANAEKAEMVAFCDIIPERAQKAAEEYGTPDAKVYTDYKAMLADHEIEIDVVHVCTPMLHTVRLPWQHLKQESMSCVRNQWHTTLQMHVR